MSAEIQHDRRTRHEGPLALPRRIRCSIDPRRTKMKRLIALAVTTLSLLTAVALGYIPLFVAILRRMGAAGPDPALLATDVATHRLEELLVEDVPCAQRELEPLVDEYILCAHADLLGVERSPANKGIKVARLSGIGACYEAKGRFREAGESFEKAGTQYPKDISAAENLNNAARDFGQAGEKDRAIELYKRIKKNFPTTAFARDADRFIAQLSV